MNYTLLAHLLSKLKPESEYPPPIPPSKLYRAQLAQWEHTIEFIASELLNDPNHKDFDEWLFKRACDYYHKPRKRSTTEC